MLQAMNTGHAGSMTTIHANSPRDAMTRLEHMMGMAGVTADVRTIRQQISAALSVVVQISRLSDGRRKVMSIQEIVGMEGDTLTMQELFRFEQTGQVSQYRRALIFYVLALLAKPSVVGLPLVVWLYLYWARGSVPGWPDVKRLLPFV